MVKNWNVDILILQETKMFQLDRKMEKDLWGRRPFKSIHESAEGRYGGIVVAWNTRTMEMRQYEVREFSVSVLLYHKAKNKILVFVGVYGPCEVFAAERLWES